jgi:hypothetical protein
LDANETPREINAQCQKKGPLDSTFVDFGTSIDVGTLGNSYNCLVDSSVLTQSGTYEFKVVVSADSGASTNESNVATVVYDKDKPSKPKYITKDKKSDCKYELEFRTADDGQTVKVELYRDFDKEISINSSNKIETVTIGSDEKDTYTDNLYGGDCGKTPYYAVVAFDVSGNASDPRSESIVTTVTTTSTETEEVLGALEAQGGANLPVDGTQGTGTETGTGTSGGQGTEGEGSVLGEEVQNSGKDSIFKSIWFWLAAILVIIALARVITKKNRKS